MKFSPDSVATIITAQSVGGVTTHRGSSLAFQHFSFYQVDELYGGV
jgi:hypothetical protein